MIDLVKNALSPAEVVAVFENPEHNGLMVVVEDDQLSLAIGKQGKNARLAVRLTKERIDIKSITEIQEMGFDHIAMMAEFEAKLRQESVVEEPIVETDEVIETVETDEVIETVDTDEAIETEEILETDDTEENIEIEEVKTSD